jgi:hypothetical protein
MQRPKFRPTLEILEKRIDLACLGHRFVVTNPLAQTGRGSLTWAVEKADHSGDRIVFARGTIAAELLHPITLHRGVSLSGGPGGVLLLTAAPITTTQHNVLNRITIVPIGIGGGVLD